MAGRKKRLRKRKPQAGCLGLSGNRGRSEGLPAGVQSGATKVVSSCGLGACRGIRRRTGCATRRRDRTFFVRFIDVHPAAARAEIVTPTVRALHELAGEIVCPTLHFGSSTWYGVQFGLPWLRRFPIYMRGKGSRNDRGAGRYPKPLPRHSRLTLDNLTQLARDLGNQARNELTLESTKHP